MTDASDILTTIAGHMGAITANEGNDLLTAAGGRVGAMTNEGAVLTELAKPFMSIFFILGLITVVAHAWQRFNEPSFSTKEALPHTLMPLRYLFLRAAYKKARYFYVGILLGVYCLFVAPGSAMANALSKLFGLQQFPAEAWPLVVAVIIAGVLPNFNVKLLTLIEESLRRLVHESFLVPHGIARTIGILEDADYQPPAAQLNAVASPLRDELRRDLKRPRSSLRYRWARTRMLMESLNQMGAGGDHPLHKANFDPFQDDFEDISAGCKALALDIEAGTEKEATLVRAVDKLLKRIYAYISWGLRYQADSQQAVDDTLAELGFRMPEIGGRRLFDIVAPPVVFVALIAAVYSLVVDGATGAWQPSDSGIGTSNAFGKSVVGALTSMIATSVMYGCALLIALRQRESQIEQKVWRQGSPARLLPIVIKAGLITWGVIVITTIVLSLPDMLNSLPKLATVIGSMSVPPTVEGGVRWNLLPARVITALPWFLAGATVSVMLAYFLGGDVRRTTSTDRKRDALVLGVSLALAAAAAQLINSSLAGQLLQSQTDDLSTMLIDVLSAGIAGFLCGAIIGFMVPWACRMNLAMPPDPKMAMALRQLMDRARASLTRPGAAEDWVFTPHNKLGGITPAEGVQYKGLATGVYRLLEVAAHDANGQGPPDREDRTTPIVVDANAPSVLDAVAGSEVRIQPTLSAMPQVAPSPPRPARRTRKWAGTGRNGARAAHV